MELLNRMSVGPALCLYFAALRCTTNPPSVPLTMRGKNLPETDLTLDNCPPAFQGFLEVWSLTVPIIQRLSPENQHDLARIICGLEPASQLLNPRLNRLAAELRAVAIEISQRRSFQERYASDLQAAIDSDDEHRHGRRRRVMASFAPPPEYEPSPSPSPKRSPNSGPASLPPPSPSYSQSTFLQPPMSPTTPSRSAGPSRSRTPSPSPSASSSRSPPSPSFTVDAPAIQLIRETLYASLADELISHSHVRRMLISDPPRAYFASVALAILDVARSRTSSHPTPGGGAEVTVEGVLGAQLTLAQCPRPLQPFMHELGAIGVLARTYEEEDTQRVLEILGDDSGAELPEPRMERVQRMLEYGVSAEYRRRRAHEEEDSDGEEEISDRRRSIEGRAIGLANRINALALGMVKLKAFRDRQDEVFKILASVSS